MISVVDVGTSRPINNGSAVVTISAITAGSSPITNYTVTPSPATVPTTFTSTTPTVTVTGLTSGTSYTYSVTASNSTDTSAPAISSAVVATTVPDAPTIGAVTTTSYITATIAFTAGATGGTPITGYTVTSSPSVPIITTGTTSPLSIVGDFVGGQLYTFTITAQNANGSSLPSSASASVNSLGPNTTDVQASGKNNVINGDFSLWNRGTSFTLTGAGSLPNAERWLMGKDGTGSTVTVSRQAFVLGAAPVAGYEEPYYYQCAYTTAGTGGTYFNPIYQNIDDVRAFAGNTITVSFWAKADATRTATVNFGQIFGTGGSTTVYTPATSVTVGTTWARYSSVITVPAVTGKTIGTGSYSQVLIQAGTTNAVQTWSFWGIQAEIGSGATTFNTSGVLPNLETVVAGSVGYDGVLVSTNTATNPSGSGVNSWAGYQPAGKNLLLNGAFDFWTRGVSQTTTGFSTADCWYGYISNTTTISQETTDLPVGARYGIKWATTSSSSSFGQFHQMIPSSVIIPLRGKILTFSYYAKVTSLTGNIQPEIQYSNSVVDAPYGAYTAVTFTGSAAAPTTWTRLTYTLTVPADAVSMRVGIVPVSAQTTNGATVRIANAQLEVGNTATSFARAGGSPGTEVAAIGAQGFDGVLVSTANTTNGINQSGWAGFNFAGKNAVINGGFDVWQRDTSSTSGAITGVTAVGATTTYTATNTFVVGQTVTVYNVVSNANGLNGTGRVTAASATSFTIDLVTIAGTTWTSGGLAYGYRVYLNPTSVTTAYTADRWMIARSNYLPGISAHFSWAGNVTGLLNSIRVQRSQGDTLVSFVSGVTTYPALAMLCYNIESQDSVRFAGQYTTLSFYAKAGTNFSGTGNILTVNFQYGTGFDQNLFTGYTGEASMSNASYVMTTSWQRYSVTVFVPAAALQLGMIFSYAPLGTAGVNDYFEVTGVQVELGTTPTVFSRAGGGSLAMETTLCQRYYYELPVGYRTTGTFYNNYAVYGTVVLPTTMRITPTASLPLTGAVIYTVATGISPSAAGQDESTVGELSFAYTSPLAITAGYSAYFRMGARTAAYAEL